MPLLLYRLHHPPITLLPQALKPVLLQELLHKPHGNLVLALAQLRPRVIHELGQRYTNISPVRDVRLVLRVVQLRLHRGRIDLDHVDGVRALSELVAQRQDEVVQRGFRGAVVGRAHHGDQGEAGRRVHERGRAGLGLQEGGEGDGQVDQGDVVGVELGLEQGEVDGGGVGEVEAALDAGVEEDAVQVGVLARDSRGEGGDFVVLGNVIGDGGDIGVAVF